MKVINDNNYSIYIKIDFFDFINEENFILINSIKIQIYILNNLIYKKNFLLYF
jgi:hypothetical protein